LFTMTAGTVSSDVVLSDALQPILQLADGSFVGSGLGGMVAFDATGNVKWTTSGYNPDIATADGGIIGDVGGSYNGNQYIPGPGSTFDASSGLATGQLPIFPTQSWVGNAYQNGPFASVLPQPVYVASSFSPMLGANFSPNYTSTYWTKKVTVIGWIDKTAITVPPTNSVNPTLVSDLNDSFIECPLTLNSLRTGDRSIITSDIDRQYANAFLLTNSSNDTPPDDLTPSVLKGGNFRAYNEIQAAIYTKDGLISSVNFANPTPALGHTPDACHSPVTTAFNFILNFEKAEAHPDNGKNGVTPSGLKVFQIAEGRIGPLGQRVNMTLNSCTSTNPVNGQCNASVPPVTPYIWGVPLLDLLNQYTVNTQIFPTFYIYENGKVVKKNRQSALEDFIRLNATSQIKVSDIN
jgi:hypothetical protein